MADVIALHSLIPGQAHGPLLVLDEGLSFWGGLDPATGIIIDNQHPQRGACITGTLLALPAPKGSTAAPGALLECMAKGMGPAGILLAHIDIVPLAAILAAQMIQLPTMPVAVIAHSADWLCLGDAMSGVVTDDELHLGNPKQAQEPG